MSNTRKLNTTITCPFLQISHKLDLEMRSGQVTNDIITKCSILILLERNVPVYDVIIAVIECGLFQLK